LEKTTLACGLTVLSETITGIPSFALSYTVRSGSCNESIANNGIHHLIEHMLFKGTAKYGQKDISAIADRLGGRMNAFTSREVTQYYIKSIDEKLPEAFDLLSDIVFSSEFAPGEFDKELDVIKQEIRESEDNPDAKAFELFYRDVFGPGEIGLPIAGTLESVSGLDRDGTFSYYRQLYHPANVILSCAGNIAHERIVALAEERFSGMDHRQPLRHSTRNIDFRKGVIPHSRNDLQQLYCIIGFPSVPIVSPHRFKYMILNDILGSGMSSRLFQTVREEKGLAYTVSSYIDSYRDFGIQMIYAATDPDKKDEYLNAVFSEIRLLKERGISEAELKKSKDHIKTSLILSMESNVARMRFNIIGDLYFKKPKKIEDIVREINGVSLKDIDNILSEFPSPEELSILLYGNMGEHNP